MNLRQSKISKINMKYALAGFFFLLLIPSIALADSLCLNNSTLSTQVNVNNNSINITTQCQYGCDLDNNRCNPSPFDTLVWYIGGAVVVVIALIILMLRMGR